MIKHIHSKDPRKKKIVEALNKKSGGTKVTLLTAMVHKVTGEKFFHGRCFKKVGNQNRIGSNRNSVEWINLDYFTVTPEEAGVEWV